MVLKKSVCLWRDNQWRHQGGDFQANNSDMRLKVFEVIRTSVGSEKKYFKKKFLSLIIYWIEGKASK